MSFSSRLRVGAEVLVEAYLAAKMHSVVAQLQQGMRHLVSAPLAALLQDVDSDLFWRASYEAEAALA